MTVTTTANSITYAGNGVTTAFAFPYIFFKPTDLVVTLITNPQSGPPPVLNGGATYDYTVTGVFTDGEYASGATVTFNSAPLTGYTVSIVRDVPAFQDVTLIDNTKFPATTVNTEFDKLTVLMQDIENEIDRIDTDLSGVTNLHVGPTPPVDPLANMMWWDSNSGQLFIWYDDGNTSQWVPSNPSASDVPASFEMNVFYGSDFNVKADGVTDDTAACQAAITAAVSAGRGTVVWPNGRIVVSNTIFIRGDNINLRGGGIGTTMFLPLGNYGDVFYVHPVAPATNVFRFTASDFSIYSQTETTSGANIHLERCTTGALERLELAARYGGLFLESVVGFNISDVMIKSDDAFTVFRSGSYLCKVAKHATGNNPSEIMVTNANWRGQTGNNFLNYGLLITCVDGITIANAHIGFAIVGVAIMPATDATQIAGINVSNGCVIDTCRDNGLLVQEPSAAYAAAFGNHQFNNLSIYHVTAGAGVLWSCAATVPSQINGLIINDTFWHGLQYREAGKLRVRGLDIINANVGNVSTNGVQVTGTAADLDVEGFTLQNGTLGSFFDGITLVAGADNIHFRNGYITGWLDNPIVDGTVVTANKSFTNINTSSITPTIAANGAGALVLTAPHTTFLLNTTNNVGQVSAIGAWDGREVVLIALGAVTIFDTINLKLSANFVMTADDTITLRCVAGNWYEMARSTN